MQTASTIWAAFCTECPDMVPPMLVVVLRVGGEVNAFVVVLVVEGIDLGVLVFVQTNTLPSHKHFLASLLGSLRVSKVSDFLETLDFT